MHILARTSRKRRLPAFRCAGDSAAAGFQPCAASDPRLVIRGRTIRRKRQPKDVFARRPLPAHAHTNKARSRSRSRMFETFVFASIARTCIRMVVTHTRRRAATASLVAPPLSASANSASAWITPKRLQDDGDIYAGTVGGNVQQDHRLAQDATRQSLLGKPSIGKAAQQAQPRPLLWCCRANRLRLPPHPRVQPPPRDRPARRLQACFWRPSSLEQPRTPTSAGSGRPRHRWTQPKSLPPQGRKEREDLRPSRQRPSQGHQDQ